MTLRQHGNILAFRSPDGRLVGFHTENLEVAHISDNLWNELGSHPRSEAFAELQEWSAHKSPETQPGELDYGIRSLTINVTQICNLHCSYCAAGGDGTYGDPVTRIAVEKTFPQLKYFLDNTPDGEEFTIHFLGGEPLLYPKGIQALADYARLSLAGRKVNLRFAITTNGTLLTEKNLELLANLNCHMTISVDGPADITDRMRPSRAKMSTTAMILEGLERLKKYRTRIGSVGLVAVFDKNNTEVLRAYLFFKEQEVDYFEFTFSHTEKSDEANSRFMEEMEKVLAQAYSDGGEHALRKIRSVNHYMNQLDEQQKCLNFCGSGKSFLMIDSKNKVYTCPWVVGDDREVVGEGDRLDFQALQPYQKSVVETFNCESCWARYLCGGGCAYEHGVKSGTKGMKSLQFCRRTRHFLMLIIMYYEKCRSVAS